ncbi:unnamed protein product [Urochloa humidicola]
MEPISSKTPLMVIEGNHDIELQGRRGDLRIILSAIRCSISLDLIQNFTLQSFKAGGIHFIMLSVYIGYNYTDLMEGNSQCQHFGMCVCKSSVLMVVEGLAEGLSELPGPWVVAAWHPPWYNSYSSHYQEFECMRQGTKDRLY